MSLRGELASMTDEEAAELIRAVCPRAAVLVVAQAAGVEPGPTCWGEKDHTGARVRVCVRRGDPFSDGDPFCRDCCDAHACEGSL